MDELALSAKLADLRQQQQKLTQEISDTENLVTTPEDDAHVRSLLADRRLARLYRPDVLWKQPCAKIGWLLMLSTFLVTLGAIIGIIYYNSETGLLVAYVNMLAFGAPGMASVAVFAFIRAIRNTTDDRRIGCLVWCPCCYGVI